MQNGIFTLYDPKSTKVPPHSSGLLQKQKDKEHFLSKLQLADLRQRFQIWAIPVSFAITRGILVSFFSSAY
jgi:hypothetical protein